MRIVLNADDFGLSDDTVRGTIECFERGGISSATLMPTMPATAKAIEFARGRPELSFGVHLTFVADTTEHPVTHRLQIPALVADNGLFPPSDVVRRRALLRQLPVDQITMEIEAQLGFIRDHGVKISHVDSHGHLHKFAPFRAALRKALPRFGITRVRNVQDTYLRRPLRSPTYWFGHWWRRRLMRSFHSTDHFYMPTSAFEADWPRKILSHFNAAGDESLEIGVHPGYTEFWRSDERLGAQRFATEARAQGHKIVGWKDV